MPILAYLLLLQRFVIIALILHTQKNTSYIIASALIFLLALLSNYQAFAKGSKTDRLLFVLDGSAEMASQWGAGKAKYVQASAIINAIADSIYSRNPDIEFGLRVFGHQVAEQVHKCNDTRIEVRFTKDNTGQLALRLNDLKPKGKGSSAIALMQALKLDIADTAHYRYSLIVLQNAGDNCGDDNCSALINSGQKDNLYRIYKLQLDTAAGFVDQYCMDNTFILRSNSSVQQAVNHIISQYPRIAKTKADSNVRPKPAAIKRAAPQVSMKVIRKQDTITQITTQLHDTDVVIKPEAIVIKKGSKISTKEPIVYGTINLVNIAPIGQMKIFELKEGKETEVANIFPVGLDWKRIELPAGNYKVIYKYGFSSEMMKSFKVAANAVIEILFP